LTKQSASVSNATIHRATILQAFKDTNKPLHKYEIETIVLPPPGLDIAKALHSMARSDLITKIDKTYIEGSSWAINIWEMTPKGESYLHKNMHSVQTYGEYDIIKTAQRNPALEELPVINFSPAVKKAMNELEQVAAINDHAHQCLLQIQKTITAFQLKNQNTSFEVSGTLKTVQDSTKKMHALIKAIDNDIHQILEENE
jgi:hypothetical protein